jgi:hypothetical protein
MTDYYKEFHDTIKGLLPFLDYDQFRYRINTETNNLAVFVDASDIFFWGYSDIEQIELSDISAFQKAYEDLKESSNGKHDYVYANILYCCRKYNEQPQDAYYKHLSESVHHLFKCLPENKYEKDCRERMESKT